MMQPQFMNPKFKNMKLDHSKDSVQNVAINQEVPSNASVIVAQPQGMI